MTPSVRRLPAWRLYLYVLAPTIVIVAFLAGLAVSSVKVLGSVRAYVAGESLWSKSRNVAVEHLLAYASTGQDADIKAFEQALTVPLGDRHAREAMQRQPADRHAARLGLLDGGNHPDDIDGMITLFAYFGDKSLFKPSLDAWIEGDRLIAQLQEEARTLRTLRAQRAPLSEVDEATSRVHAINDRLYETEVAFSRNLGEASRLTEGLLIGSTAGAAIALSCLGYLAIRRGLQREQLYHQDLARAHRRWELAASGAGLGLFEVDLAAGTVTLDARAATLYGLPAEQTELSGQTLLERIVPEDRRRTAQTLRAAVSDPARFQLAVRVAMPDGSARQLETLGSPPDDILDPGAASRLIGVVRDVTQEQASAQLAVERDAAERVAASQRAFLSRLSHELRTPLNAILGFAQLLAMDHLHPLPAAQHKQVNWILDAGNQLLKLVEDVLDLSKVEAGEIGMTLQDCDLGIVLDHSLVLIEAARLQHAVTIVQQVGQPAPRVVADPQRLQQVLVNLLTNGCKYNRPGGQITVDAQEDGDCVRIDITDNGIGLTPQDAKELFQPFRRVAAASAKVEGSGLGLYIVKQLVERMGGAVTVHSEPGKGSRFSVSLPKAPALAT